MRALFRLLTPGMRFPHTESVLNHLRPHHIVERVESLDYAVLQSRGIRGVMLDLDNTLVPWRATEVTPGIEAWIDGLLQHGLRACVVTNATTSHRVIPVAERLGIPWVNEATKPFSKGFRHGMHYLDTTPDETAMIGDLLLTDILGGNRLGLYTVLVKPIALRDCWLTRYLLRPLESLVGHTLRA